MSEEIKLQLKGCKVINGTITCKTGLHIGGTAETIEIGGMDNPIIKHPITQLPYIPGSSIKGKMRSLLEWKLDNFQRNGDVHQYDDRKCLREKCPICRIFGTSSDKAQIGPSRLIVRDAFLTENSQKKLEELKKQKGLMYAEEKTENTINRLSARANPRTQERVPADIVFEFEMIYRLFELNNDRGKVDEELFRYVEEGIRLIQTDALGGSGSRGYGKVEFEYEVKDCPLETKSEEVKANDKLQNLQSDPKD
ncbi:MAG: type III-A CRISPR-associated RAMP protein Csm3 [bacterium]